MSPEGNESLIDVISARPKFVLQPLIALSCRIIVNISPQANPIYVTRRELLTLFTVFKIVLTGILGWGVP